jgi:hypothetical protein
MFIGLNPSTADETKDDPTIRRCISFAQAWGYGGLCMTNLFAYRATHPIVLREVVDSIGADNDKWLRKASKNAAILIAAWGTQGSLGKRDDAVRKMLSPLHTLRLTKDGYPEHPLYLPKNIQPQVWHL